jgi:hypothetical protein
MQSSILSQLGEVVVAGDGRMDSPGHSAQYCVYSLMEHETGKILDVQVGHML